MPIGPASELPQVSGLDLSRGLRFFAGQAEVYRESLLDFVRFYGPGLASVEACLARPSAEALVLARADVHAMGGAAAALGAEAVERQVRKFEVSLRQAGRGDPVQQLAALQRELALLVEGLRAQLGPAGGA
ncbi:Hpt domain-containing protein [Piscinibacter sp. HJYY11]|uniref:Hpt domain-containing protein n=1 Tax=Piscinibacter sp. HJYY11 TaxID=2801333 RepID=UPI00191F226F|nr:Hpt domain-containing protein [Piscinibacter sp. HJYY11]MBL0729509.1 Hpt domain-containing protein [Piscinibacter sp. HJYY11]